MQILKIGVRLAILIGRCGMTRSDEALRGIYGT
jgi:hypothetical protein